MSDRDNYNRILEDMRIMRDSGLVDSDMFRLAWSEIEALKNRHGGFPPPEDLNDSNPQPAA